MTSPKNKLKSIRAAIEWKEDFEEAPLAPKDLVKMITEVICDLDNLESKGLCSRRLWLVTLINSKETTKMIAMVSATDEDGVAKVLDYYDSDNAYEIDWNKTQDLGKDIHNISEGQSHVIFATYRKLPTPYLNPDKRWVEDGIELQKQESIFDKEYENLLKKCASEKELLHILGGIQERKRKEGR